MGRVATTPATVTTEAAAAAAAAMPRERDMYYVDLTNATGNWGSDDADARCWPDGHAWLQRGRGSQRDGGTASRALRK